MSSLIVQVCRVDDVQEHPNADRMAIATVKGWKTCIRKDPETGRTQFEVGDKCVYFPPDSVMPPPLVERLGVANLLATLPGGAPGGRVKSKRLRGYRSEGLIMGIDSCKGDNPDWEIGTDVKDHYGVTKWEPPLTATDGDAERPHSRFHAYTDIERIQNFPGVIKDGEEVVFTEKLHGKNCRIGLILDTNDEGEAERVWMAGSHGVRRKEFDAKGRKSDFWEVRTCGMIALCDELSRTEVDEQYRSVILFGEIIGSGIQDMAYGLTNGQKTFRLFDIAVDRKYLDFDRKVKLCQKYAVEMVPVLYRGPFSEAVLEQYTSGPTTMCPPDKAGKFKGREGVVVTPVVERDDDPTMMASSTNGRVILKSISVDYEDRKGGTDGH
jgi:RNA ligase (TIGR02306 family)